jgi:hypothetical protein
MRHVYMILTSGAWPAAARTPPWCTVSCDDALLCVPTLRASYRVSFPSPCPLSPLARTKKGETNVSERFLCQRRGRREQGIRAGVEGTTVVPDDPDEGDRDITIYRCLWEGVQ